MQASDDNDSYSDINENNDSFTEDNLEKFLLSFIMDVKTYL